MSAIRDSHGLPLFRLVCAGLIVSAGAHAQAPASISPNCPGGPPIHLSGSPTFFIAAQEPSVTEGEHAVFTITRRGAPGPCQRVRVRISGHDKIMSSFTSQLEQVEVVFQPGATTRILRLPTQQDTRNEGDGEIRVTIVGSSGLSYTIGHPNAAAVRVRDDDIPEVTFHAVSPAGLTLQGDTWVGDILEGNKVRFETRCSGGYQYSHPDSFLPLVDHAHEFNHPMIPSYNVAAFAFTPCNREHEFPIRQDQSYTGPAGGEIRAALLSSSDIESRWVNGRVQHDDGGLFHYFACSERDFSYCPRYTVGTPNALRLNVRNTNPAVTVAAAQDQVDEGDPVRFVITRHWDHPALFDNAQPGDPAVRTRIGYRVTHAGAYVAGDYTGDKEQDAFNLTVHEYTVEIPTADDATRRPDGAVTLELLPDSFADVNVGGTYELYESIPGITPPGQSAIRATVTIRDNEFDPILSISDLGSAAGAGTLGFTVSLTGPSDFATTVDWGIREGTALPGDEDLATGTIAFPRGETTQTISVPITGLTLSQNDRTFIVTLSNPIHAVFSGGVAAIEAQLLVQAGNSVEMSAPTVTAVPDTAGNLLVSWAAPDGAQPASYQMHYRERGTAPWASATTGGPVTHLPILFLQEDTDYEVRVRAQYGPADADAGAGGSGASAPSTWSDSGFGRTGVHQPGSEPLVTLALTDPAPATEGEPALLHILVSELRNSYQWRGFSDGIVIDLEFQWRKRGSGLVVSSQLGIVPGVFTVDHVLGGYRDYRVWLPDWAADHGPVTIAVQPGDGYRVGEAAAVCVSIADSATMEATPCADGGDTTTQGGSPASGEPTSIAVRDASASEGVDETISFEVTLSHAAPEQVTVDWSTADATATAGEDYVAASGTLVFAPGDTARTVTVTVLDDAHDEGEEMFALHLSNAVGAVLADAEATGTIANSDPLPRAWLGRFGRTAWEHALGAVDERLRSTRVSRTYATIGGRSIAGARFEAAGAGEEQRIAALARWVAGGDHDLVPHAVSGRELLAASEFQVTTAGSQGSNGSEALTVWGQGGYGRFAGRDADLSVSGDVASGTLGVDYAAGPWLAGLALSHSTGWGSYAQPNAPRGEVTSSLTGAYPYIGFDVVPGRLALWLAGGYGLGGLHLAPRGGEPLETGIGMLAGAAGVRATLVPAEVAAGFALGLNVDGMLMRATSDAVAGLAATTVDMSRLRLGLDGSYALAMGGGALLTPSVEVGVRRDGGGADTGFGMDIGGGLSVRHPGLGLSAGLRGRALMVHDTAGTVEWGASGWLAWDPNPASALGPSLTVSPSIGAQAQGGIAALWSRDTLAAPGGPHRAAPAAGRIDAKFGYGLPLAAGTGTPWAGIGLSEDEREYRLGYEFQVGPPAAADVRIALEAKRRERVSAAAPEHTLALHSTVRW